MKLALALEWMFRAGVAELADARDSKSRSLYGSVGSTPSSGISFLFLR